MKDIQQHSTIAVTESNILSASLRDQVPALMLDLLMVGDELTKFISDAGIGSYLERKDKYWVVIGDALLEGAVSEGHSLVKAIRDFINVGEA